MKKILTGIAIAAAVLAVLILLGYLQDRLDPNYEARINALEERIRELETEAEETQRANEGRMEDLEREYAGKIEDIYNEIEAVKWDRQQSLGGVEDRTGDLEGQTEEISGRLENIEIDFYGETQEAAAPEISWKPGKYSSLFRDPEETQDEEKKPGKYSSLFEDRKPEMDVTVPDMDALEKYLYP